MLTFRYMTIHLYMHMYACIYICIYVHTLHPLFLLPGRLSYFHCVCPLPSFTVHIFPDKTSCRQTDPGIEENVDKHFEIYVFLPHSEYVWGENVEETREQ